MPTTPDNATDATTLGEALAKFEQQGFTGQFGVAEGKQVVCFSCHMRHPAKDTVLHALIRTEGASDPDDMTAVAAVVCPHCHAKGTLVVHFGALATPEEDDVLRALEDDRTAEGVDA
jgi:hypothetical protein